LIQYLAYTAPSWLFAVVLFLSILVAMDAGYRLARRLYRDSEGAKDTSFDVTQTAVFAVSGLVLAFSYASGAQRFDARRGLVVKEANAIGTTYLRASFLPVAKADRFRRLLRDYTQVRLAAYRLDADPVGWAAYMAQSSRMQRDLWDIGERRGNRDPRNVELATLNPALTETFDVASEQQQALTSHIPPSILGLDVVVTVLVGLLNGFAFGRSGKPNPYISVTFALLLTFVVFTIADLDRPQGGLVHVSLAPLERRLESMHQ
jgi:hypothetical protein